MHYPQVPKKIAEPAIAGCTPERISAGINRAPTAAAARRCRQRNIDQERNNNSTRDDDFSHLLRPAEMKYTMCSVHFVYPNITKTKHCTNSWVQDLDL